MLGIHSDASSPSKTRSIYESKACPSKQTPDRARPIAYPTTPPTCIFQRHDKVCPNNAMAPILRSQRLHEEPKIFEYASSTSFATSNNVTITI